MLISTSFYLCFHLFIEVFPGSFCLFYYQKISVWKRKVNDVELKRTRLDLIIIKVLGTNEFGIHIVAYASFGVLHFIVREASFVQTVLLYDIWFEKHNNLYNQLLKCWIICGFIDSSLQKSVISN